MKVTALLALLLILAGFAATATPGALPSVFAQDGQVALAGRVVSGTAGMTLPERVQVALITIDSSAGRIIETKTADAGSEGRFRFDGPLLSGPNLSYRLVVNTAEGLFAREVDLATVQDWGDIEIKVYETTPSMDGIHLTSFVMLIPAVDARTRMIAVLAVADIQNSGDKTWLIDPARPGLTGLDLVRFSLPEGYRDLTVESDLPAGNILEIGTGFAITNPVPPGEYNLLMSYVLPYTGSTVEFPLRLPFGGDLVRVLIPEGKGRLTGDGFGEAESVILESTIYDSLEGKNYPRGATVNITITGLPQPSLAQRTADFFKGRRYLLAIVWTAAAVMLVLLLYAFLRSRKRGRLAAAGTARSDETATVEVSSENELGERQRIVAEIVELDEQHEAGRLPDAEYKSRRDELKRRALKLETGDVPRGASR